MSQEAVSIKRQGPVIDLDMESSALGQIHFDMRNPIVAYVRGCCRYSKLGSRVVYDPADLDAYAALNAVNTLESVKAK